MDGQRFDAITKVWSRVPRRRVLAGLAGSALGAVATALGRTPAEARTCRTRQQRCSSKNECCGHKGGTIVCKKLVNCDSIGGDPLTGRRCCGKFGAKCSVSCDCCGTMFCGGGTCEN